MGCCSTKAADIVDDAVRTPPERKPSSHRLETSTRSSSASGGGSRRRTKSATGAAHSRGEIGLSLADLEGQSVRVLDEEMGLVEAPVSPASSSPSVSPTGERPKRPHRMSQKAVDWEVEAMRIARGESFEYGTPAEQPPPKASIGSRASATEVPANSIYTVVGHNYALWTRATEADRLAVVQAFATNTVVERVDMVNALVSDALGVAWGGVLRRNGTLTALNLESNSISTDGIVALAEGLRENSTLKELKLANQRLNFTQQAEQTLAEALEGNYSITRLTVDLRNTRARELINKYLQRNQDELRRARLASKASMSQLPECAFERSSIRGVNVADWAAEAERVATSALLQYGMDHEAKSAEERAAMHVLTGSKLWGQATEAERLAVVQAFATNTVVERVDMVNALVSDALGVAWGGVLRRNGTLTALNLESNSISTDGIVALAEGLRENSTLKELKLANQRLNFTQQAEQTLAEALEGNYSITRLTVDLRNTRARELINKYLQRNQDELRRARLASKASMSQLPECAFERSSIRGVNVADWAAEAERVATSALLQYGMDHEAKSAEERAAMHVLTGSKLWGQATEAERLAVVQAFATNTVVERVDMVNALVSDALGVAWGGVLRRNGTLTALNLESNSISTDGIVALAEGLRENSTLKELKLANQRLNFTQQAEQTLAEALEGNYSITRLTVDLRSIRAKDLINKYLQRNQDERRRLSMRS